MEDNKNDIWLSVEDKVADRLYRCWQERRHPKYLKCYIPPLPRDPAEHPKHEQLVLSNMFTHTNWQTRKYIQDHTGILYLCMHVYIYGYAPYMSVCVCAIRVQYLYTHKYEQNHSNHRQSEHAEGEQEICIEIPDDPCMEFLPTFTP